MTRPMYDPPQRGQPDCDWRAFPCDLETLALLLEREGAELGLVTGSPRAGAAGREAGELLWHRADGGRAPAECEVYARREGALTALALRARPRLPRGVEWGAGLLDSPAHRHAFSLVAGALTSAVLSVALSVLALGPRAPILTLLVVGFTVGGFALSVFAFWGVALLWARWRAARARARAARWRRAAAARLFAAIERGLRRAGPYR